MSSAKKLQSEIDRVLKAVVEGQEIFEDIWCKVHEASTTAQKEKYESELKAQIKKLQRLREQIKTWIAGDLVKDKQPLMDARKRIEQDMERFKVCEKETKTKAYSKDGLAAAANNDPETRAKMEARDFLESCIDNLNTQKDTFEAELEVARAKKKSKAAPTEREKELDNQRERHNWHVERIELMLRLLDNDNLTTEDVNSIKDDFEYYITSNQDPDFQEDETIYDALDLDAYEGKDGGLDVLKQTKKEKEKEAAEKARLEREEQEREENRKKEEIRKAEMEKKRKLEEEKRLKEEQRRQAEAERRKAEEDRRKAQLLDQQRLQQQQQQRQQDAAAAAAGGKKPGMDGKMPVVGGQPGVPASQVAARGAPGPVPGAKGQMPGSVGPGQQGQQGQQQGQVPKQTFLSQLRNESGKDGEWEHGGLGGGDLAQDNFGDFGGGEEGGADDHQERLNMLEASMKWLPDSVEPERPFKPLFDNPTVFEKLDQDTLFFIFYFQTGTLQQFLAARELKRQGWRFHKKYLTWFQRHEEPVSTDHQGERGTYVYFDYETGWCQRIKSDFTFDYYFLEDEVVPAPPRMD